MYRPAKRHTIQLPRLETLPGIENITYLLSRSRETPNNSVELVWTLGDSLIAYHLRATTTLESSEPTWDLLVGEGRDEIQVWTYQTGDVALVLNLVLSESTDTMVAGGDQSALLGETETRNTGMTGSYSTSLLGLQSLTSTHGSLPVFEPNQAGKAPTMEGTLQDMPVPQLLQSTAMGKMTGKLTITNDQSSADLYFVEGDLVHASAMSLKGDQAIMELVTWEKGKFYFYRDERTNQKTVTRRVDALLMESVTLLDQSKFLLESGLKMETYIAKKDPDLTETGFEERISTGAPCDMNLQKQFYLRLDGNSSLFDILREHPMVKKDWVPVLFNMLRCDLIALSDKPLIRDKTSLLKSTFLDRSAIDAVVRTFIRPDTGLYSYTAFQYFLEQELFRFQYSGSPFSVIVFELFTMGPQRLESLPVPAVGEAGRRIGKLKRSIDVLAHFEALNYALLLPNTETASAAICAHRIIEVLTSAALAATLDPTRLSAAFGIAGVPEDCKEIGLLLSAAKVAKNVAQKSEFPIIMFKDLQAPSE
ncbi:MAG: DUF4388 domain-containing protein [Candidatus Obscuribacterales bacterium]|nr:DUF4388 domain-containing protein [Candidatus Obscuribacterales bacterium]